MKILIDRDTLHISEQCYSFLHFKQVHLLGHKICSPTCPVLCANGIICLSPKGSNGSKTLPLKEGRVTEIKIEVTAEDGTTKFYTILAKRLSAKDASLSSLTISGADLSPAFSPDVTQYYCKSLSIVFSLINHV